MDEELLQISIGIAAVASVLLIAILIGLIRLSAKLKRLRKQYTAMMDGGGVQNMEQIISGLQERLIAQEHANKRQSEAIVKLGEALSHVKGRVGVNRYNAFSDEGSDLSFSIAIIDDHQEGVVISGIHSREETYVYAKPLKQGESPYPLTPEERQAINLAGQPK